MVIGLLSCVALIYVFYDEALQEVFSFLRMLRESLVLEVELPLDDVTYNFKL